MMTLQIELAPELIARLEARAQDQGLPSVEYARRVLENDLRPKTPLTPRQLLRLPQAEQDRYFAEAAEAAAPLYEADLALPPSERELTAFSALEREPFLTDSDEKETHA